MKRSKPVKPKRESPTLPVNPNKEQAALRKLHKKVKTLVKIIAAILVFTFTWLEFHDLPIIPIFTESFSNLLFKIILALFFISWTVGVSKDLEDQESVFLFAPNKGKLGISGFAMILTLGALFACLCLLESYRSFALALSGFYIFNIACWYYYRWFVRQALEESEHNYKIQKDFYGAIKLKTIRTFLWGHWQRDRFIVGCILLIFLNVLVFSNLPQILSEKFHFPSSQFVIVLAFLLYIGVTEIWIWKVRFKRDITYEILESLKEDQQND